MTQKTFKGNMYPGVKTWNPLGGRCMHACSYCSTETLRRFPVIQYKYSGEPRLFNDLFSLPSKPQTIFVVAQNDLFANNVPTQYVRRIIDECRIWDRHMYLFQSKNPDRFRSFLYEFPKGSILCTTIETNRHYSQMGYAPNTFERAKAMSKITGFEKQVTIEPLFDFDLDEMVELIKLANPDKVNIGADSKHHNLPEPSREKVLNLIDELKTFTTIDRKTNLERLMK
jgi:protein gp37